MSVILAVKATSSSSSDDKRSLPSLRYVKIESKEYELLTVKLLEEKQAFKIRTKIHSFIQTKIK